jgi:hypothetical protein
MGVDAKDYNAIGLKEDLNPYELELKKLLDVVSSVNTHMAYMKQREAAMRDTNGKFVLKDYYTIFYYVY